MKKPGEIRVILGILAYAESKALTITHAILYVYSDFSNGTCMY
jgi:hypothetical protein